MKERRLHFLMPGPPTKPRQSVCGRKGHLVIYESGAVVMRGNGHSSYMTTKVDHTSCPRCLEVLGIDPDDTSN